MIRAHRPGKGRGKALARQGPGRDDHALEIRQRGIVKALHRRADQRDARLGLHPFRHGTGKKIAVHGQRLARRNAGRVRRSHERTAQLAQFLLDQTHARGQLVRAQGVGTHQLGQIRRGVGRRIRFRLLLEKSDGETAPGQLQRAFATGKTCPYNGYSLCAHGCPDEKC